MPSEEIGFWGFNKSSGLHLIKWPRGTYTAKVFLYSKDTKSGVGQHKTFPGDTPEEAVEKAVEFMNSKMLGRPTITHTGKKSIRFPARVRTGDDEVKELTDSFLFRQGMAKHLENPPVSSSQLLPGRTFGGELGDSLKVNPLDLRLN